MKTPPKPWIHTGLYIHPRLARFLKKWGFTRESEPALGAIQTVAFFNAIVKGKPFNLYFFMGSGECRIHNFNRDIQSRNNGIPALNKFMRDNS